MVKTTGSAPCGARPVDPTPFGHWQTQTFIAALRHDRLDAPWVIGGAINREIFDLHVETQLAPTLQKGDVVILENLATHRSPKAAAILKDIGAWFVFLPPCSPTLASRKTVPQTVFLTRLTDRDGIRQDQDPDTKGRRPNLRPTLASGPKRLQHLQGRRMLQLLQSCRI